MQSVQLMQDRPIHKWPYRTRQPATSASLPKLQLAHCRMQAPNLPVVARVIASVFSTIAWLLHVLDTYFQWRTVRDKSKNYLWKKISFLAVVIAGDIFIIAYVECEIKEERTTWVPAWWALIGFSMLLSLSVEVRLSYHV